MSRLVHWSIYIYRSTRFGTQLVSFITLQCWASESRIYIVPLCFYRSHYVIKHLYLQTHVMSELSPFWPPTAVWGGAYWHQLDSPRWTGRGRRRLQREKAPRQSTTFPTNKPADAGKTPLCFGFDSKVLLTIPGTVHLCLVNACWAPASATTRHRGRGRKEERYDWWKKERRRREQY